MDLRLLSVRLALCLSSIVVPASAEAWHEYKTEHFILDTDTSDDRATQMMAALEKARAADVAVLAGGDVELPGHIRVIAPASKGLFMELAGEDWISAFYAQGPYGEPVVFAPVIEFLDEPETVAHELAHAVSHYLFPQQPQWYAEGLAEFVQTVNSRPREASSGVGSHIPHGGNAAGAVGGVPDGYGYYLSATGYTVPSAKLLTWDGAEDRVAPGRYHAASWVLYHYLWNHRGKALAGLQKQLIDGVTFDKAWRAAFPDLDPKNADQMNDLDDALLSYARSGRFIMAKVDSKPDYKVSQQAVSQADMRLWLLHLRQDLRTQKKEDRLAMVRTQLEKARAEEPKNPAAAVMLAALDGALKPEAARAAAEGAPQDFRGWYALGVAAADPKEKEMAMRKAVALGTECPACNNNLAWFLATSGRAKEALPFANRALDLAPWDSAAVDTLAEVALQLMQCPQALQLEARAASMDLAGGVKPEKVDERLESFQARCAGK
jgi:hypothetical protein